MIKRTKHKTLILSFLMGIIATGSIFNNFKALGQKPSERENSKSAGVTCYLVGPNVKARRFKSLKEIQKSLENLQYVYDTKRINKETYERRKSTLLKEVEPLFENKITKLNKITSTYSDVYTEEYHKNNLELINLDKEYFYLNFKDSKKDPRIIEFELSHKTLPGFDETDSENYDEKASKKYYKEKIKLLKKIIKEDKEAL